MTRGIVATIYWTLFQAETRLPAWNGAGAPDFLSGAEQERLARMRFPKRRREWLLGRWTIKKLLQVCHPACAGLTLDQIEIAYEAGGAPYWLSEGRPALATISISHREDAAACACAPDLPAGIDLEQMEARSDAFIQDFFTASEASRALALDGEARHRFTALVWSAKEAALKALRTGLRLDTRAVEVAGFGQPGEDGWGKVQFASQLNELKDARGWWRVEGARLITLAALVPPSSAVELKYLPIS